MKRNVIRIVYNPIGESISYYYKNEIGQWCPLSNSSILSRHEFTKTTIKESAIKIIKTVDEVYNRKNKGLDILFEGKEEDFDLIEKIISEDLANRDIACYLNSTKIVVVGKKESGKTTLITAIGNNKGHVYKPIHNGGYTLYKEEETNVEWYEIDGIDLGKENIDNAKNTIKELVPKGITTIVYCIKSSTGGRMEKAEKDIISSMLKDYPELEAVVSLTFCVQKNQREFIDEIERMADQIKVVQTLAKEYETIIEDENGDEKVVKIAPYGLNTLSKYVFERR